MFSRIRRSVLVLIGGAAFVFFSSACDNTANGDRCDPFLSHDECANAPTYQCVPSTTSAAATTACNGEAYCCAVDPVSGNVTSTEFNCIYVQQCIAAGAAADGGDDGSSSSDSSEADGGTD
jgi:hypothetical protein